jgi:hypothetical protein
MEKYLLRLCRHDIRKLERYRSLIWLRRSTPKLEHVSNEARNR